MKKIFLLFAAAVAALSSCVKENGLEPQVNTDSKVTINAVAVDSKTVLDGLNVVWENEDALSVVLAGDVTSVAEFSAESVDGAEAKFVHAGTEALALEDATSAYAVYPVSAVSQEGGVVKISHSLPEVQTGVVESGMNLSSAALSVEELVAGQATAQFKNALALLQVVVPAGVSEVSLHTATGAALVGDMTFNVVDGVLTVASTGTKRTVTLSTGSELAEGTHNLLVYPGYAPTLTLTMTATDGAVYESTVQYVTFAAGEARKIDLTKIFNVATEELHVVLPAGGTVEVPVVTTDHYQYEVSMSAGADAWVSYSLPTKSFHKETIVFTVAENDTNSDREAEVTIAWGDGKTKKFKIQQKNIFMDFVNDADGNPIQWEETFGLYADQALGSELTTFTNVFTIALSDDFSKGTYKVSNLFKVDSYWFNGQQISNKGGEFYANYDADKKELTVLKANSVSGYTFSGDVVLIYDVENKAFSAETISATLLYGSAYYGSGATRYIGNYAAAVKVEKPAVDNGVLDAFVGTWSESFDFQQYSWMAAATYTNDAVEITIEDGKLLATNILKITPQYGSPASGTYVGEVSADGLTVTFADVDMTTPSHMTLGPVSDFVLTLSADGKTLSAASACSGSVKNYVATKAVNPLEAFVGTWSESFDFQQYSWMAAATYTNDAVEITIEDGKLLATNILKITPQYGSPASGTYVGEVSADGLTVTFADVDMTTPSHMTLGPVSDFVLTLSTDGKTLSAASACSGSVKNYVAIK